MRVAAIGRDVADGLAAAHAAGVVHRDVKPGNVLIGTDGRVKLTDFGVSRAVDDVQLTRTGLIAGTPAFLAPEIAQGRTPTAASDVFALGATLYAAVEGAPPFGLDDNAYALLHKVATEAPQATGARGPAHPGAHAAARGRPGRAALGVPGPRPAHRRGGGRDGAGGAVADGHCGDRGGAPVRPVDASRPGAAPIDSTGARPAAAAACAGAGRGRSWRCSPSGAEPRRSRSQAAGRPRPPHRPPPRRHPRPPLRPRRRPRARPPPPRHPRRPRARSVTGNPIAFVQRYYALLPGDPDAAFALLGPTAQSQSGGRAAFTNFYGTVAQVAVEDARHTGDNTVSATVRFVLKDGRVTREPYRFVISTAADGSQLMEQFDRA